MAQTIVMSSLGSYTAEGRLIGWLKPSGTWVEAGEPIAEIETEKATFEVEASASGILYPVAKAGMDLPLETVIGYLLEEGEAPPINDKNAMLESPSTTATKNNGKVDAAANKLPDEVRASPIAKRLAREFGLDLAVIAGSGPGGRIVESDVKAAFARREADNVVAINNAQRIRMQLPLTGMRGAIAHRMRESLATAASLTLTREVDAEILVAARRRMQTVDPELSYDALFLKIFADSLRECPELNAAVVQEAICVFEEVNVGFAVAVPGGLLVPVVHNAASMSLPEIMRRTKELRERAFTGRLRAQDLEGGTATLSNLGAHGVDAFTPILNPPESAVLGVGRIADRAIVRNGQVAAGPTVVLSLTFDHRVTDGVPAAQLLGAVARRIGDPNYFAGLEPGIQGGN